MSFVGVGTPSLTVQPRPSGGGGVPPGNPNSIAYYDPLGVTITTDANLTAFPLDPFGRPQIWDKRLGGAGAVYRNGSWTQDGDPTDVTGDGIVSYGPNAAGLGPNGVDGGYARVKPNRFGLAQVVGGGPLTYYWRVDQTQMVYRDDLGVDKFSVDRATGNTFIAENGRLFMGNNGVLHGSSARVQLSTTIANAAQFRGYQYGANAAGAGITTFKSRSLVITPGAPPWAGSGLLAGDLLGRWTAIGVAPDNSSIPLAALISLQVPASFVPAAQNYVPSEYELALVPLAGPVNGSRVVFKVSSEGETQSFFKLVGPGGLTTQAGFATYNTLADTQPASKITSDATGGLVVMGAGGALAPDTRIRRIAQSGGVPQVVVDDNAFAAGAVNVIPASDGISKLGTRSAANGGNDPVSVRWAEVNTLSAKADNLNLPAQAVDPAAVAGTGFVYTKVVTGITQLFYRDSAGNVYQLTPRTILDSFKFSGSMTGTPVVLKARFLGDVPNSAFLVGIEYPATGPSVNATLRVKPSANTLTAATNFRVFVNGVASGLVVVIPAGTTAMVSTTAALAIVAGDWVDLRMDVTAGGAANSITAAATLVFQN